MQKCNVTIIIYFIKHLYNHLKIIWKNLNTNISMKHLNTIWKNDNEERSMAMKNLTTKYKHN